MTNSLRRKLFVCACLLGFYNTFGQNTAPLVLNNTDYNDSPLAAFIDDIERETNIRFYYKEEEIESIKISGNYHNKTVEDALKEALESHNISFTFRNNSVIIYKKKNQSISTTVYDRLDDNIITVGSDTPSSPIDEKVTVSGFVKDGKNGEELYGATIIIDELNDGVSTNKYGYYTIELEPGIYALNFNYIGFESSRVPVLVKGQGVLDIELFESSLQLKEVKIREETADHNVSSTSIGTTKLDIKTIEKMPAFLGEVDLVKSLLLLPGVTTVGEGAAGFNVRGGGTDQNLFLFDNVPVFNASHLFGFFSNFNSDVVKNVTLYKGGIPAKFGNRASSVLNVTSKDANDEKLGLSGGLGLVSSRLTAELPIVKGKSSLLLGGRSSYSDWILNKVNDLDIRNSSANFYDANAKWTTNIGKNDRISISGYLSQDRFKFAADPLYNWQTQNLAAKWNHLFSNKLSTEVSATYGDYSYNVEGETAPETYELNSGIINKALNFDIAYLPNNSHKVNFGGIYGQYTFKPGVRKVSDSQSIIVPIELENEYSRELALYIQDDHSLTNQLSLLAGIRYSMYDNIGPGEVLNYANGIPKNNTSIIDTTFHSDNEVIKSYNGFEPRLSLKYSLTSSSSIKLSYNRMRQYIHTISNTVAINPIDIWKSSDPYIAPQIADQISAGYFRNFNDNNIETSVEVYFKRLDNIIDYKNGAVLLLNETLEQELLSGLGRAYGAEFYIKKKSGRLTGWASYTYSKTERKIKGASEEESINLGEYYPADYDKPHNLSLVANYQITRRWRFGANFTYSSGRPVTVPQQKFTINGTQLAYYSERNAGRIPDYHRLDFSVTLEGGHKKKKILDGSWTISLYNVYGRRNAYSVFFKDEAGVPPRAYKLSVLGTIFPSLSYHFEL